MGCLLSQGAEVSCTASSSAFCESGSRLVKILTPEDFSTSSPSFAATSRFTYSMNAGVFLKVRLEERGMTLRSRLVSIS